MGIALRRLSLLRHAKARREERSLLDHARGLTERGVSQARLMANCFRGDDRLPDCVLCSTSQRTRQTWNEIAGSGIDAPLIIFSERLYHAEPETILSEIASAPDVSRRLLVIGHNPGLHELALILAENSPADPNHLALLIRKFPTAALATFEFDIAAATWREAAQVPRRLVQFVTPKDLAA